MDGLFLLFASLKLSPTAECNSIVAYRLLCVSLVMIQLPLVAADYFAFPYNDLTGNWPDRIN